MNKHLPPKLKKVGPKRRVKTYDGKTIFAQDIYFEDYPEFRPNLTPRQVIQMGSFGGSYFCDLEELHNESNSKTKDFLEDIVTKLHSLYPKLFSLPSLP